MHGREFGRIEATIRATIRACREDDLPALEWMGLYARDRHIIRETFEAQVRDEALMLLAVSADFPIAQVWLDFAREGAERMAVFWAIRTFFPLQRAGIGRKMMHVAERVAHQRGFPNGRLEVDADNEDVCSFYRDLGWRSSGRDEHGRRVMIKALSGS